MQAEPLTVYKASAGSGKTFTLALQYIKLLVEATDSAEYAHVLAVTFTNKATAEMKDRIVTQLYNIAHSIPDGESYFHALRDVVSRKLTDNDIRRRCNDALYDILHDYSQFRVQTIDSFFQVILRGLAHELGLMSNPQVEISDTEVLSRAVDQLVDRLEFEPVVQGCLMGLVGEHLADNKRWDVRRDVKSFGRAIFNEQYLSLGDDLRLLLRDEQFIRQLRADIIARRDAAVERFHELGNAIEQCVSQSGYSYSDFYRGSTTIGSLARKLQQASYNYDKSSEVTISATVRNMIDDPNAEGPLALLAAAKKKSYSPLWDVADELQYMLRQVADAIEPNYWAINSANISLQHLTELQLLEHIDREVAAINEETSRFNLSKTPILLARMIRGTDAPFVFEKIGARLHHVMIDEFQDTSRLQWSNFKSLLLESFSHGGHNLVVGDVKQSIYRFRGGDWRMLGHIESEVQPAPVTVSLDTNYRSSRNVVRFNNAFFSAVAPMLDAVHAESEHIVQQEGLFAAAYSDVVQQLPSHRDDSGYVKVTLVEIPKGHAAASAGDDFSSSDADAADASSIIIDDVVQSVLQLLDSGVKANDMAILVRNRRDALPLLEAFALDSRLPAIVSNEAFLLEASDAVTLIIDAMRVLDDAEKNSVARYHLEQAGLDIAAFDAQTEQLAAMPLYQQLETIYKMLPHNVTEGQDAYIFGLLDAALDYIQHIDTIAHGFITYWDEKLHAQPIASAMPDGIRLMTVHQAKGLEFHTVLLPACSWKMETFKYDNLLWCRPVGEPYEQLRLMPVNAVSRMARNSAYKDDFVEEHLLANLDELNVLYVALTRATSNLLIWSAYKGDTVSLATTAALMEQAVPALDMMTAATQAPVAAYAEQQEDDSHGDEAPQITTYTVGTVVASGAGKKQDDTRMSPQRTPLYINMYSNEMGVEFRQSNRSREFLASIDYDIDGTDETLLAEQAQQSQYIETGKLLHHVLQNICTLNDVDRVLTSMEHEGTISSTSNVGTVSVGRHYIEQLLLRGFRNPMVANWFSGEWTLFNECTIVSVDEHGVPQHRRPDRVMISRDKCTIMVVDFKFGRMRPQYEDQVREYMSLLAGLYPNANIRGYLWMVYQGQVAEVEKNE